MNIAGTEFILKYNALEIYLSGCQAPHCVGCHNPELWDFSAGNDWADMIGDIVDKIISDNEIIKNIFIVGGEPLDQDLEEFSCMVSTLRWYCFLYDIKLWLFTKYDIDDVFDKINSEEIFYYFDYIKSGRYKESLKNDNYYSHGIKLASKNQFVYETKEVK